VIDSYVWLAPLLLASIVGLLAFIGCDQVYGLSRPDEEPIAFVNLLVDHVETTQVSAVSADYAGAAPVTAGNLLIAWIWYHTSSDQTVAGVADSAGNVYARADDVGVGEGALATGRQEVWYAKNARAAAGPAPTSITATFTGTVQPSVGLGVFEYANAEAAAPLVTASQQAGTGDEAVSPLAAIGEAKMVFGAVLFSGEGVHDPPPSDGCSNAATSPRTIWFHRSRSRSARPPTTPRNRAGSLSSWPSSRRTRMLDSYVLLAPVLLIAIVGLLGFVGCNQVFGLDETVLYEEVNFEQALGQTLETTDTATSTVVFINTAHAGNMMLVWTWYHTSSNQSVASVTDSVGNVFQRVEAPTAGVGLLTNHRQEVWYARDIAAGGPELATLTVTFTGTVQANIGVNVLEYQGADKAEPIAGSGQATGSGPEAVAALPAGLLTRGVFGACVFADTGTNGLGAAQRVLQRGNVAEDYLNSPLPGDARFRAQNPPTQDWLAIAVGFK
jgi:hypothetical protein